MEPDHHSLIHHPYHEHPLLPLSSPPYRSGFFNCYACNTRGRGPLYHCKDCNFDLATRCASLPPSVYHSSHPLNLTFHNPYPNNRFYCSICRTYGSTSWLYRCSTCKFDAHLDCANGSTSNLQTAPVKQSQPRHQSSSTGQHQNSYPGSGRTQQPQARPAAPTGYNKFRTNQHPNYYAPAPGGQHANNQDRPAGNRSSLRAALGVGLIQGVASVLGEDLAHSIESWTGIGGSDNSSGGN